jgi:hypothetical protein
VRTHHSYGSAAGTLTTQIIPAGQVESFILPQGTYKSIKFGAEIVSGGGFQMGLVDEADYQKMINGNSFSFYSGCALAVLSALPRSWLVRNAIIHAARA